MFECHLGDLQSLVEVCIGISIAYLALSRFRYQSRIKDALRQPHDESLICARIVHATRIKDNDMFESSVGGNEDISEFRDGALTFIFDKERLFKDKQLGSWYFKLFFYSEKPVGTDQICVSVSTIILFVMLVVTSFYPESADVRLVSLVFVICIASVAFVLSLIKSGNKSASEIEKLSYDAVDVLRRTYRPDHVSDISGFFEKIP